MQVATPSQPGHLFSFSVLCGDRLGRLILHLHTDSGLLTPRSRSWVTFLTSEPGLQLTLTSLAQCSGLSSLYIQHIATDAMLAVVAQTCTGRTRSGMQSRPGFAH